MQNSTAKLKASTLVLGANGKTGSRVIQRLSQLGWPVRSGSRSGSPKFDWQESTTWKKALQQVQAVYIAYQPDLATPGAVEIIRHFTETAVNQGVNKLVLLSGRGEKEARQCGEVVMNAGVQWTVVRASWFNQNFSEGNFLEPILAGHVALPVGDVGEPFVDADDIAEVAVAALTQDGHHQEVYEVTGPRLLTFKEAIQEIADATGRRIQFEQVSMEAYTSAMAEYGIPEEIISLIRYLFTEVLDGRNACLAEGVERALRRPPTDFSEYAKKAAAAGTWKSR